MTYSINMEEQVQKKRLTREQKTGFVLLLVFAILVVGLGMLQIRNTIYGPFTIRLTQTNYDEASLFQDDAVRLQNIDTDHDGLNDYEELTFYETSPYLPDTDSDGLSDKMEIENGTDPLCSEGGDCSFMSDEIFLSTTSTDSVVSASNEADNPLDLLESFGNDISPSDVEESFKDVKKMREMLVETGLISAEELAQVSDDDLAVILGQVLSDKENINESEPIETGEIIEQ